MHTLCLCLAFMAAVTAAPANAQTVKFLIVGDTQKIVDQDPNNFLLTMDRTLTDPVTQDADFILQMGDLTEDSKASNWDIVQAGWRKLDGHIPYVLNIGNNDLANDPNAEQYNEHFPLSRYRAWPSFVSSFNRHNNAAHRFTAGGVDWLVISVEFTPTTAELEWAEKLIADNPDKKVIFISHAANSDGSEVRMCKKYQNVVFVLCGHTPDRHELLTGDHGSRMGWVKTCHHSPARDSYFCLATLDTAAGTAHFRYYSPQYGMYWDDPDAPYHNDLPADSPWTWTGFDFKPAVFQQE